MSNSHPYASFQDVSLEYPNGTIGLSKANLSINEGEFIALVGPSGSGKTTLLNTLAGFVHPTTGSVSINGQVVADESIFVPPEHRHLGMVFQQHALWPHMSVGRNVEYPLKQTKTPQDERRRRVNWALKLVGLEGFADRNPSELSGGQSQRVAIARAIGAQPSMLLLDEALSALDEPLRESLRLELRHMTIDLGLTTLHVTHDRGEAIALADRIVMLDHGHIRQIGTPDDLLNRPADPIVASFFDDATLFEGQCDNGIFRTHKPSFHIPTRLLQTEDGMPEGPGTLAVLPDAMTLVEDSIWRENTAVSPDMDTSSLLSGTVMTSLYGPQVNTVVVKADDLTLRCHITGARPRQGEHVGVRINKGIFYPGNKLPRRT